MNAAFPPHDPGHVPVMLAEVMDYLAPRDGGRYVDGTFGGGGYARAILASCACQLWGIDRDPAAIARGQALAHTCTAPDGTPRLHLLHGGFAGMAALLAEAGVARVDGIVLDLGVSSYQIDQAERGFSFRMDGPLDMRMGDTGPTAADVVNTLPEDELADIIYHYGEERLSRRVARAIVAARAEAPLLRTTQLADVVRSVVRPDRSGIDPATRTFQGLRIHVNDELGQIRRVLEEAPRLLAPGGRLVVVSFHSLEDRLVKQAMALAAGRTPAPSRHDPRAMTQRAGPTGFRLLTGRPIRPGEEETRRNPRARSARLRALECIAPLPLPESDPAG
ncbi:16S rRNA (cytosine(1402)-N(4))-methyltransferase RsmH [Komagataeibacter rhaeticus]|uniref:Ribosomal RNA small subunit methyltransferase H n=1 Tax=Komagataeibacter rhaeticus TaxID=215221 RepID=A0A181CBS0_9PROT|nr:16S rRNA (cytosine(1402)-N(4))-methyltransferase RsmH [Komagataeibacter rhaeticus]ATU72342.1 16S rRNA (cytosine(1402)-N(4))-methyltransferase RsmH [Komagataeibacter xylinus]QIP35739.1 16S rRNA (cytosine(1402)-N(4))-methyltransferase RsmH [Komagataeibacter rhaeticus]QOC45499.1 16S rRNA (cytosine(1402)-N(4))-methyltransferase RsmH [Komagataeibacter rhaeticus]WPP22074.1 16S rRNA (cytosine(1402)-N(4))-methyltransferase RsmH [Komagataeibacter rhaeticus]SAY49010.1 Ribosomal RNA small subunit meth